MFLEHFPFKVVQIPLSMSCDVIDRDLCIEFPIEVMGLSSFTLHHEWMLREILIHRSSAAFLHEREREREREKKKKVRGLESVQSEGERERERERVKTEREADKTRDRDRQRERK
jgi:hypothetical protein